jgi:ParB/RepB/Spo0J family partition protein
MSAEPRRLGTPNFGSNGGTNLAEYIGLAERVQDQRSEGGEGERIVRIPVDEVDRSPYQVRVDFDSAELAALAEDIGRNGLTQPVTVRRGVGGRYELVAGERRWLAAKLAGRETIEARIRELDDFEAHLVGVSENNQRADLSPWEKALETLELRRHAAAAGRPHAQRDLARYLHRNVAIVNQQLAIAAVITPELLVQAGVDSGDVCRLPHESLQQVARRGFEDRPAALLEAVRMRSSTTDNLPSSPPPAGASRSPAARPTPPADDWTRCWEAGGFRVHIRKPIRDVEPERARAYLEGLLPAVGALAARAEGGEESAGFLRWRHARGQILVVRPSSELTPEQLRLAKEALADIISDLEAAS